MYIQFLFEKLKGPVHVITLVLAQLALVPYRLIDGIRAH